MEHSSNPTSTNYRNPEWKSSSESRFQQKSGDATTIDIPVSSSSSVEQQRSYIPSGDQALFDQSGSHRDRSNFESPSKAFDSTVDNTAASSTSFGEGSSSLAGIGSGSGSGSGLGSGLGFSGLGSSSLGTSEGLSHRRRDTPYYRGPTEIEDDTQPLLGRSSGNVPFSKDSSSLVSNDQSAFNKDSSSIPSGGLWSSGLSSVGTTDLTSGTSNVNDSSSLGLGSSSIGAGTSSYNKDFTAPSGVHDHVQRQTGTSDLLGHDSTTPVADNSSDSMSSSMPRTNLGGAGIAGADAVWPGTSSSDAAAGSSFLGSGAAGTGAGLGASDDIIGSSSSGVERSGSNYDSMNSQAHASSLGFGDQSRINQDLGSSSLGGAGLGSSSLGLGGDQSFGSSSLGESSLQQPQQNMSEAELAKNNWAPDEVNPAIAGDNVVATGTGQKIKEAISNFAQKIVGKSGDDADVDSKDRVEFDHSNYNNDNKDNKDIADKDVVDKSKDKSKDNDQSKGSWFGGDSDKGKEVAGDQSKSSWFGGDSDKGKEVAGDQSKSSWFGGDSDKSKEVPIVADAENPYITNEQRLHKLAAEEAAEAAKARRHE